MEKKFSSLCVTVNGPMELPLDRNCFGYLVVNKGDNTVVVDQIEVEGYPVGHPEARGLSMAIIHPLAYPFVRPQITVGFIAVAGGTLNRAQIIQLINY